MKRDPRKVPFVGDVIARQFKVAKGGCILREVTRSHGGFVHFGADNGYYVNYEIVPLWKWQRWADKAEVIEVARGDKL